MDMWMDGQRDKETDVETDTDRHTEHGGTWAMYTLSKMQMK